MMDPPKVKGTKRGKANDGDPTQAYGGQTGQTGLTQTRIEQQTEEYENEAERLQLKSVKVSARQ